MCESEKSYFYPTESILKFLYLFECTLKVFNGYQYSNGHLVCISGRQMVLKLGGTAVSSLTPT